MVRFERGRDFFVVVIGVRKKGSKAKDFGVNIQQLIEIFSYTSQDQIN